MMDWRALSRSRSRMSIDWRQSSRSRSRPPLLGGSLDPNDVRQYFSLENAEERGLHNFPFFHPNSFGTWENHQPPNNGLPMASNHSTMSHPVPFNQPPIPASQDMQAHLRNSHSLSELNTPIFQPSSLPSSGFYGSPWENVPSDPTSFPRRVRKTSFDHTVSKDGILPGEGRHQVNGKPSPASNPVRLARRLQRPLTIFQVKRRAAAHHIDSLLRGDPVLGMPPPEKSQSIDVLSQQSSGLPSIPFNFNVPGYDGLFDLSSNSSIPQTPDFLPVSESESLVNPLVNTDDPSRTGNVPYMDTTFSSSSLTHSGIPHTNSSGSLSSVGPASSLNHSAPSEEDLHHLLGLTYSGYNSNGNTHLSNPFAYVDPSHILGYPQGNEGFFAGTLQASPASEPTTGFNSSATASPEPGTSDSGSKLRKTISIKHSGQPVTPENTIEDKSGKPQGCDANAEGATDNSRSDDKEPPVTLCSNCHTTNTPLWRRDAEGQPLCKLPLSPRASQLIIGYRCRQCMWTVLCE
jgi:GATA-binding protein